MRFSTPTLSALAFSLLAAGAAAAAPYTITNLGTLGGKQSYAYAINDAGLVVGHSSGPQKANQTDPNLLDFNARAFLFNGSTMGQLGPVGHLGLIVNHVKDTNGNVTSTTSEVPNSFANAVNKAGVVVGYGVYDADPSDTVLNKQNWPLLFMNGQLTTFGLPPNQGSTEAIAEGVNDANLIVGRTNIEVINGTNANGTPKKEYPDRAFVYNVGSQQWTLLPVFDTAPNRGAFGLGINNAGTVMGSAGKLIDGNGYTRAYRWNPGETVLTDLGAFAGKSSYPYGINAAGKIVGQSSTGQVDPATGGLIQQGFLSEPGSVGLINLGYLHPAKQGSVALGINDRDQVVGYSAVSTLISSGGASDLNHAFLSEVRGSSRIMLDLNNMLSCEDRKRWVLIEARGINYNGQIAGVGTFDGQVRAFLLNPPTGAQSGTVVDCPVTEPSNGGGGGGSLARGLLVLLAGLGLARRSVQR